MGESSTGVAFSVAAIQTVSTESVLLPCDIHSPTPTQSTPHSRLLVNENLESITERGVTSACSQEFDEWQIEADPLPAPGPFPD